MKSQNGNIEKLTKVNDIYELKVEDMCVEMSYNDNKKRFNECILNILKKKVKTGWHIIPRTLQYKKKGGKSKKWLEENQSILQTIQVKTK